MKPTIIEGWGGLTVEGYGGIIPEDGNIWPDTGINGDGGSVI